MYGVDPETTAQAYRISWEHEMDAMQLRAQTRTRRTNQSSRLSGAVKIATDLWTSLRAAAHRPATAH